MSEVFIPWFSINVHPTRVGVYPVAFEDKGKVKGMEWYSYWNGRRFNWLSVTRAGALEHKDKVGGAGLITEWKDVLA